MSPARPEWLDTFLALIAIPGKSLHERAVADDLIRRVGALGLEAREDGAAAALQGDTGNLHVTSVSSDEEAPWITFMAHMDCVEDGYCPRPVVEADQVRSEGSILGADNRAAVCLLLDLLAWHRSELPRAHLQVIFTAAEENGLRGAKQLDMGVIRGNVAVGGRGVYMFDSCTPVGSIITRTPRRDKMVALFEGVPAHAGVEPEKGRSAIRMAARFLSTCEHGRLDADTTVNFGRVAGGVDVNTVAAACRVDGECRSYLSGRVDEVTSELRRCAAEAAAAEGGRVAWEQQNEFRAYEHPWDGPCTRFVRGAMERCGLTAAAVSTGGGSDANVLNAKGVVAYNLGLGYQKPHSHQEVLPFAAFEDARRLVRALVTAAGD